MREIRLAEQKLMEALTAHKIAVAKAASKFRIKAPGTASKKELLEHLVSHGKLLKAYQEQLAAFAESIEKLQKGQ